MVVMVFPLSDTYQRIVAIGSQGDLEVSALDCVGTVGALDAIVFCISSWNILLCLHREWIFRIKSDIQRLAIFPRSCSVLCVAPDSGFVGRVATVVIVERAFCCTHFCCMSMGTLTVPALALLATHGI